MTKADLVERIAESAEISKAEAEGVVKTVLDSIVEALRRGEKIELRGFGSFRIRKRRPRQGRNPKTGVKVHVPGKAVPYFKPGKELREMLNPGEETREAGAPSASSAVGRAETPGLTNTPFGDTGA